jgi:hypothetical protein
MAFGGIADGMTPGPAREHKRETKHRIMKIKYTDGTIRWTCINSTCDFDLEISENNEK